MSLNSEERALAYEKLTPQRKQLVDKVMENLEKGNLFWTQGWVSSGAPESAITGKKYRGINNLFLSLIAMSENYGDNRWATFKQMEEKGWTFKKDEEGKGASIEYYEMRDKETKRRFDRSVLDGMTASEQQEYMDKNVYWLRKFYRVFNCSLMDGVPVKEKPQIDVNDRNDRAEAILDYWDKNESKIVYGGSRAFYRTDTDEVHLPERADFKSTKLTAEDDSLFKAVVLSHSDLQLKPVKVSRQVVAGMNYCYECVDNNKKKVEVVVYKPLPGQGDARILSIGGKEYTE